jgi:phosphoglycolate phosphatase-like HAD superfamily hydrolase
MTVCFDIDGVLCDQVEGNYADAKPRQAMIDMLNRLYDRGYRIILHTSRFMGRAKSDPAEADRIGREFTVQQLAGWGVRYHELWMGKPRYTYVIDDRSVFYQEDPARIEALLEQEAAKAKKIPGE